MLLAHTFSFFRCCCCLYCCCCRLDFYFIFAVHTAAATITTAIYVYRDSTVWVWVWLCVCNNNEIENSKAKEERIEWGARDRILKKRETRSIERTLQSTCYAHKTPNQMCFRLKYYTYTHAVLWKISVDSRICAPYIHVYKQSETNVWKFVCVYPFWKRLRMYFDCIVQYMYKIQIRTHTSLGSME